MKFGTSGVRGLVADMTDPVCAAWTRAFLHHLRDIGALSGAVLVGRDLRPSSERIAGACMAAIAAEGLDALDAGALPTPALALAAAARGLPAIMVTGSHIPFDRNGLKFYRPEGEITKADEAGILAALSEPAAAPAALSEPAAAPAATGTPVDEAAAYVARNVAFFGHGALAGRRVGVYEHSAVGRDLVRTILEGLGAVVVGVGRTDTFVPIDTEAIDAGTAGRIAAWVAAERLDALVSTDGDGDRPLVADETGTVLRGDAVGILAAHALGADTVAAPLNVSTALERSGWFARTLRTRIGSPYVIEGTEALAAGGATLAVGFESNGGFMLGGPAAWDGRTLVPLPTRDALLPMLALLVEAARQGVPLSALRAALPERATASGRVENVPEPVSRALLETLEASAAARDAFAGAVAGAAVADFDTIDGLRMMLVSGETLHLRPSGNAPELRCYAEAGTGERAEALVAVGLQRLEAILVGQAAPTG